ncbi:MAG: hypothetical protein ACHQF0_12785 [Chitinophagales bacterium]
MTAFEQLDYLLSFFYSRRWSDRDILFESLKTNPDLLKMAGNSDELERMIGKLKEDKFILDLIHYPKLENGKDDMSKGLFNYFTINFEGRLFYEDGGYVGKFNRGVSERNRLKAIANQTLTLTLILALGTLPIGLLSVTDLYWKYHWFRYPFWWGMIALIIFLSVLTSYLVYRLLEKKKSKKR